MHVYLKLLRGTAGRARCGLGPPRFRSAALPGGRLLILPRAAMLGETFFRINWGSGNYCSRFLAKVRRVRFRSCRPFEEIGSAVAPFGFHGYFGRLNGHGSMHWGRSPPRILLAFLVLMDKLMCPEIM